MVCLSRLNAAGISIFEEFLSKLDADPTARVPVELLDDDRYSQCVDGSIEVDQRKFKNGYELGEYLNSILLPLPVSSFTKDAGMWTWLSLMFFDYISPADSTGWRRGRERAIYVLSPSFSFRSYYRHVMRSAWQSYHVHGKASRVLLITSAGGALRSDVSEQIGAYADIFKTRSIIRLADRLWYDDKKCGLKRGAGGKGSGTPRRLVAVLRQLQLTYDLEDCSVDLLLELLPAEFDRWR